MKHGKLDKATAKGIKALRKRIAKANIPSSKLDESITIATWNIRDFGKTDRLPRSIHYIAEILNQFDLIAITEVRDNLSDLSKVMGILGPYWQVVFSDYDSDRGGNRERVAYVFDKRAVTFTGLAAEADGPRKKNKRTGEYLPQLSWWRKPYMVSFRSGSFDFVLITAHIRWADHKNDRIAPLKLLAQWVDKRRKDAHVFEKDFIVMGDFNIPKIGDKLYEAITGKGLRMPAALADVRGSNLAKVKRYDQILHVPMHKKLFTENGGVLDFFDKSFDPLYEGINLSKAKLTYQLSDHLPLWIQLNVDLEEIELDQIL